MVSPYRNELGCELESKKTQADKFTSSGTRQKRRELNVLLNAMNAIVRTENDFQFLPQLSAPETSFPCQRPVIKVKCRSEITNLGEK